MNKEGIITSVHQRLSNIARKSNVDFNSVQLRYVQERFLYRLSKSIYREGFILKGALLFLAYKIPELRPTKDIDFLCSGLSKKENELLEMVKEICTIEVEDGVIFDTDSIKLTPINIDNKYPGFRIRLIAFIGTANVTLWLDIGFGDKVIPCATEIEFPQLLDYGAPIIKTYSLESAIAEKFEACVKLNFDTSRMKDFYDIYQLASSNSFDSPILYDAIKQTFAQRGTDAVNRGVIFSDKFKNDVNKQKQWVAFQNRSGLNLSVDFPILVEKISEFFEGIFDLKKESKKWNPKTWKWE